ncbi:MAG: aldehyde ferredoxin oxidoreductase family protein [Zestosphaera sp.]
MFSYMGRVLELDLTKGKATPMSLSEDLVRRFIGGRGIGASFLWDLLKPGVDPLSPENVLIFSVGPLTGTSAQSSHRWVAQFKSPLTATYFRSVGGGFFGAELKFAGYDAVVVRGRAERPTYVYIENDVVEFRKADVVWGMTTDATRDFLRDETSKDAKMAVIGPAGERLVRISAIVTDDMRTAARGGGGAVMGSKNLKAIVVKGSRRPAIYDEDAFREVVKEQIERFVKNPVFERLKAFGTDGSCYPFYTLGHFPTYNFKQLELDNIETFRIENLTRYMVKHYGCYGCMIRCGKVFKLTEGPYAGVVWDFPEYETHWSFGGNLGISNVEAITVANMLCDKYGLDTISTGVVIGLAYELYEKGIIDRRETGGLDLRWGDPEPMVDLVRKIALREGIGGILAEGVRRAAEALGRGAERFAMHVKGLELPAYDPRSAKGNGLNLVTSPIGASHTMGWNSYEIAGIPQKMDPLSVEGKAEITKYLQDRVALIETGVFCTLPWNRWMMDEELYSKMLYAATGIKEFSDVKYLLLVGERIFNLERLINAREGIDGKYDKAPLRIVREPVPRPPSKGQVFEEEILLKDYYRARGWDERGIPMREKLNELGLSEVKPAGG